MTTAQPPATPETKALLQLIKTEYIQLLNDLQVITEYGKPQLEALYATLIGKHQLALYEAQLSYQTIKRKLEYIRAAVNRDKTPDLEEIEEKVAAELAETQELIFAKASEIAVAEQMLSHLESPERSARLRRIYRRMAKWLHPDLNPHLGPAEMELWHQVSSAYEYGDVDALTMLELMHQDTLQQAAQHETLAQSDAELRISTLKAGIAVLQERIATVKNSFPFTHETLLKDDAWVAGQQQLFETQTHEVLGYTQPLQEELNLYITAYA